MDEDQGELFEPSGKYCGDQCNCSLISGVVVGKEYYSPEEVPESERSEWLCDAYAAQDLIPLDEEARELHAKLINCPRPRF